MNYKLLWFLLDPKFDANNELVKEGLEKIAWDSFIDLCKFHKVLNLVAFNLLKLENYIELVPKNIQDYFQQQIIQAKERSKIFFREIALISAGFDELQIPYVFLKGPIVANLVYPAEETRTYNDLDLLASMDKYREQYRFLRELGYQQYKLNKLTGIYEPTSDEIQVAITKPKHAIPFSKYDPNNFRIPIDLHWSFFSKADEYSINVEEILTERQPFNYQNIRTWRLSNEGMLFHACIHHYWHLRGTFIRLKPLLDIVYIAYKFTNKINWEKLLSLAKNNSVEMPIALALYQADMLYPNIIPASIIEQAQRLINVHQKNLTYYLLSQFSKANHSQGRFSIAWMDPSTPPLNPPGILLHAFLEKNDSPSTVIRLTGDLLVGLTDEQAAGLRDGNKIPRGSLRSKSVKWIEEELGACKFTLTADDHQEIWFRKHFIYQPSCEINGMMYTKDGFVECTITVSNESSVPLNNVQYIFGVFFQDIWAKQEGTIYTLINNELENFPANRFKKNEGFRNEQLECQGIGYVQNDGLAYWLEASKVCRIEQLLSSTKSGIQIGASLGDIPSQIEKTATVRLFLKNSLPMII